MQEDRQQKKKEAKKRKDKKKLMLFFFLKNEYVSHLSCLYSLHRSLPEDSPSMRGKKHDPSLSARVTEAADQ